MVGAGRRSEPTGADATRPARDCSRRPRRPQMPVSDTSTRARARRLARRPRASAWRWRYARERGYADTGGREGVPRTPRRADNPDDHRQAEHDRYRARRRRVRAHPRHGEPRGWRAGPYPMGSRRCQHAVRERENRHQHDPRRRIAARSLRDVGGGPPGLHDYDIVDRHVDQLAARRRER